MFKISGIVKICLTLCNTPATLERAIFIKFSELILRKVIKTVATRCQILSLKFTKLYFGWGFAPDPVRKLTTLPRLWI